MRRAGRPLVGLDHADLVLVAAEVLDEEPADVLATADVALLSCIASRLATFTELADAAAEVLVAVAAGQPFGRDDPAIAWLATVVLVERNDHSIAGDPDDWVRVVRGAADSSLDEGDVATALAPALHPEVGRMRRLVSSLCEPRAYPEPPTHDCPACGADVDRSALWSFPAWAVPTRLELVAACARLRGVHDRTGEPIERRARPSTTWCPVVLGPDHGDATPFVALTERGPLAFRPVHDGDAFDVVEVDELAPSDLVGEWSALWARGHVVARVPAACCRVDAEARLDWRRAADALATTAVPA